MHIYLSHCIRGKYGIYATQLQMDQNCKKAILIANVLRNTFPEGLKVYCPAEHEDFVGLAYHEHYLSEEQILEIDCEIIDTCDQVIIYIPVGDECQGGRLVEYEHAARHGIPVTIFKDVEEIILYLAAKKLRE